MAARKAATVRALEDRLAELEMADGDWTAADVKEADAIRRKLMDAIDAGRKRRNVPTRRNAPLAVDVAQLRKGGALMSRRVLSVEYFHLESAGRLPYRHDFDHDGVELYALPDGSILLRHPRLRLWEDRLVGDDA
jgi:hypothetical protein